MLAGRSAPDLRTFLVVELCVSFQRYFRGETSDVDDLLHRIRECTRRVPVLPASDEAAFGNLKEAIGELCTHLDQLPAAFGDLKHLLATGMVIDAIPTRFSDRLTDIDDQPIAVEHLRQRILRGTQDGAILLHGPDAEVAERLSSAFARAMLGENAG